MFFECRFSADELVELVEVLEIPERFVVSGRYKFSNIEALCLLLARFRSAGDIALLAMMYNRSISAISQCVNELSLFIDDSWGHLLDFDSDGLLRPSALARYAQAIHVNGDAPIETVWGFIDCTIRRIARPTWYQRQAYNGHKKFHSLKFQAVVLPDGMFAHLYGPFEGRRADPGLLAESGLLEKCTTHARKPGTTNATPIEDRYYQLFGDPAYGVSPVLLSPFARAGQRSEDEQEWNVGMSSVRIEVEHGFGIVVNTWPFLNAFWKLRVYASPVGVYYRVAVLLTNARNCYRPNQISQYFACRPPTVREYFH